VQFKVIVMVVFAAIELALSVGVSPAGAPEMLKVTLLLSPDTLTRLVSDGEPLKLRGTDTVVWDDLKRTVWACEEEEIRAMASSRRLAGAVF
jgi:hypothetical protein